ncbi:Crp/Fnr family transcriptional regulator [Desulfococcus sp.]|uniref:Crp/Fnr family transcriptional regulator n=1 Tax=Desulfococcus sp. TaxID=2025834 RepID=UPI003593735A
MDKSKIADALEKCDFFEGLEKNYIETIAGLCQVRNHAVGEAVFSQGEPGEHLYIIIGGLVFLERTIDLGSRKGRVTIESLGPGRVLGCWSTLLDEAHVMMSTAICQEPTTILTLRGLDLRRMMVENQVFGFSIMEKFCHLLLERIQAAYGALEKI